jgi:hypothetical protein
MSRRTINLNPIDVRRESYSELELSGESQRALWKAIEHLAAHGVDVGPDAAAMLSKRLEVKKKIPK